MRRDDPGCRRCQPRVQVDPIGTVHGRGARSPEAVAARRRDAIRPSAAPYEIANILHRKARTAATRQGDLERALDAVMHQVSVHPLDIAVVKRAMAITEETMRPAAYDAQDVALAETLGCELWTADERLWNAVRIRFPFVRWVGAR